MCVHTVYHEKDCPCVLHVQVLACVHTRKDCAEAACHAFLTRAVKCVSNLSDHLKSDLTQGKYGWLKMKQTDPIGLIQPLYFDTVAQEV